MNSISYDGKEDTWKNVYEIVYKDNLNVVEKLDYKNKRYQKSTEFIYNGKKSKKMYFSGDIVFNFFDDGPNKRGKRRLYKEMECLLHIEKYKGGSKSHIREISVIEEMLNQAKLRTECKANVSIMPSTGGLQFVKQAVGRDRLDTFVWCLDEHYKYNKTILFNHCAAVYMDKLESFLTLFDSAEDYCRCIYNISTELTRLLIKSGSQPINTPQRVKEYITLANKFWDERVEYFEKLGIENAQCK